MSLTSWHLCCGAGGISLGFHQAGLTKGAAFDISGAAVETHKANFPDVKVYQYDIKEMDVIIPADIWTMGLPCESYSNAGYRLQEHDPRDLTAELCRLIHLATDTLSLPAYIFLENVPPYRGSPAFNLLVNTLVEVDYYVHEAIYAYANYGVCQKRKRWHLIARLGRPPPTPVATHTEHPDLFGLKPWVEFRDIRDHDAPNIAGLTPRALQGVLRRQRRKMKQAMDTYSTAYNVMQITTDDDQLPTVTASWHKSISRNQVVAVACWCEEHEHWYYRGPSELEIRRAQGFPDDFKLVGTKQDRWGMVGRAVAPPYARAVAEAIKAHAKLTFPAF